LLAVAGRREEVVGPGVTGGDHLLLDAADRADVAVVVDGAGTRDDLAAGQVRRVEFVDDAQGEHHAGARTADVVQADLDRDRRRLLLLDLDADLWPAVAAGDRRDRRLARLAATRVAERERRADRLVLDEADQVVRGQDLLAVDGVDDVPGREVALGRLAGD